METRVKTFVEIVYRKIKETKIEEVEDRDPSKIKNDGKMVGFFFFDKDFLSGGIYNSSRFVYFGKRVSIEEIEDNPEIQYLVERMKSNGTVFACRTQIGTFLELSEGEMTYDEAVAEYTREKGRAYQRGSMPKTKKED